MPIISIYSRLAGQIERKKPFTHHIVTAATVFTTSLRLHDGKIIDRYFKFTGNQNYRAALRGFSWVG